MKLNTHFILFFSVLIIWNTGFSQINILENNHITTDTLIIKKFYTAYSNFIKTNKCSKSIILTDYKKEDSISLFILKESKFLYNFNLKKPDICLYDSLNIIYIFTDNWYKQKDTKWLNKVLYKTIKTLDLHPKNTYWTSDSIFRFDTIHFINYYEYSPPVLYKVYKNNIISKEYRKTMLYPMLSIENVLNYYNIKPDRLNRIRCPLSKDSLPYIKINKDTNYWYCRREGCSMKNGGIIELIMKLEKITRRQAEDKLKEICINKRKQKN